PSPSICRRTKARKCAVARGVKEFNIKARRGLQTLQSEEELPSPHLTAAAVAEFLRHAPGLDRAMVGSFLGEAGVSEAAKKRVQHGGRDAKGSGAKAEVGSQEVALGGGREVYQGDTAAFHAEVLEAYVELFDFSGQPLLMSLRMFLASFRLPGEAQQIDRILQAFAQRAYKECLESKGGLLASADVAYLLSFSVIMLNTDLHNPNIRPEKRMSLEGFVRNNANYGRDISGDNHLPRELLELVYTSIRDNPIVTCEGGAEGEMTIDRWRDLLRHSQGNSMVGHCRPECADRGSGSRDGRSAGGGGAQHDQDVLGLCWPAVLKAASAAF
ncbi:unnamed protein product, partial [Choristocarpus tenellus]